MSDAESIPEGLQLGFQLMAPLKAACEGLEDRTGLSCELAPRPNRSSRMQLALTPQQVFLQKSSRSTRPDTAKYQLAVDCDLALTGRGAVTGNSLRAEALQAHFVTAVALEAPFEVPVLSAVPNANVPDGAPEGSVGGGPPVTVDAEAKAEGTFYQTPDPSSSDWEYDARWLVTCRYPRAVVELEKAPGVPLGDYDLFETNMHS